MLPFGSFLADIYSRYDNLFCSTIEEALHRVKRAVKVAYPGCYFGGITLRSGRRGFAIYWEGKVIEQYSVIGR